MDAAAAQFSFISVAWLFGVAFAGSFTDCSTLSCVMDQSDIALAAVAQVLALQAFIGQLELTGNVTKVTRFADAFLALGTGLAPYSVAGTLHNYLALALFLLRVFQGIQRTKLSFNYVMSLISARALGIVFLHGYGCHRVFPELCTYAAWPILPSYISIWVQFGFAVSGITSIVLVKSEAPVTMWQGFAFVTTALYSSIYGVVGLINGQVWGALLFFTAAAFDSYLARRLVSRDGVQARISSAVLVR